MIEHIKTTILSFLILISVGLTWLIWNYQPEYEALEGPNFIEIEEIGESRSLTEVIHPKKILIHEQENISWIHPVDNHYTQILEELSTIELDNLKKRRSVNAPSLHRFYRGYEIVFSQAIKGEWLDELFTMPNDVITIEEFDRIIFLESLTTTGQEVFIQLIDINSETIYESETSLSVNQLHAIFKGTEVDRTAVEKRVFNDVQNEPFLDIQYVASESITLRQYMYDTTELSPHTFKQVLFNDPDFVKQSFQTFTDGNRMMNILEGGSILSYVHPGVFGNKSNETETILEASLSFINSHEGWTDDYYIDHWRESFVNDHAKFRLHVEGMPIYSSNLNNDQFYTIELSRSGNQITEYVRPLYNLEDEAFEIEASISLPSFEIVEQQIQENESYTLDSVEDAQIGYRMIKQGSFVVFQPKWYVKVHGRWTEVQISANMYSEVLDNGLE